MIGAAYGTLNTMISSKSLALRDLRKSFNVSQTVMAERLDVKQAEISKMERRPDMYISTLAKYVNALGGKLQISAQFPELPQIYLTQFEGVERNPSEDLFDDVERTIFGVAEISGFEPLPKRIITSEATNSVVSFAPSVSSDWFNEMLFPQK